MNILFTNSGRRTYILDYATQISNLNIHVTETDKYAPVAFYKNNAQKNYIEKTIKDIESKFENKQVVTLIWKFKKFYPAEDYHQDYYQKNFLRYLSYKKSCQREEVLKKIWN